MVPPAVPIIVNGYVPGASVAGTLTAVAADPGGVTEVGLDAHVAPVGNPVQVKLTDPLKAPLEPTFTV